MFGSAYQSLRLFIFSFDRRGLRAVRLNERLRIDRFSFRRDIPSNRALVLIIGKLDLSGSAILAPNLELSIVA